VSLYCFENVRTAEQRAEMARLDAAGICLFCPEYLASQPQQPILLSTAHWSVTPNKFPYQGTSLHLLLVPHQHAGDLLELSDEVRSDFWVALAATTEAHGVRHYGLGVRNGDCRFTGASIAHVHAHVLVGSDDPDAPPVRMRFSSRHGYPPRSG
jgi:diadenosine tetraphosphate (Ap4A) HIT family hydrolase